MSNNLSGDDEEEIVVVRRIDRRLEAREKSDFPWLRRIVGFAIIAAAFIYGWRLLTSQSNEVIKRHAQTASTPGGSPGLKTPDPLKNDAANGMAPASGLSGSIAIEPIVAAPVPLDGSTLNTISDCTKGANAFRHLDLNSAAIGSGTATIESVFNPVLISRSGVAKRIVQLQNVRIRLKSGDELRLHAAPKTQNGRLYLKLFHVAADGLPEEADYPEPIKDLKDQPLSDAAVTKFLLLAEVPGRAIEVERHESWSYPEKAGAQIIWSDDRIFEIQVFMPEKFLTCSRGERAGNATMTCKCVERNR